MNADFNALKERFKKKIEKQSEKKEYTPNSKGDIYPHWNAPLNSDTLVRILKDADENNPDTFYIEKYEHKLSVIGKDGKEQNRTILCIFHHFGETCPICELSKKYYNAKDETTGKYYYRSKKYLLRGLIIADPIPPAAGQTSAVGQIKKLQFTQDLIDRMLSQIASELDSPPWDLHEGFDFKIRKQKGTGAWPDYIVGSGFVRNASAIPQELIDTIQPVELKSLLPPNPGAAEVQRLLNSHLTGEAAEEDGNSEENEAAVVTQVETKPVVKAEPKLETKKVETPVAKAETPKTTTVDESDDDADADAILEAIKARKAAKKTA